ncbi:glycosyltransferase family 2 protein [Enterococcus casseliflavus]|nr:glycosyltransferase family 2 protein [Enterococcus casseliflavus]
MPVYNVEEYLHKCLKSVVDQSYQNFEVILVNDGSTDNSLEICEEFTELDCRFKLYNKINGGLSSARNFGLSKSIGKYIVFIDSDDFVSEKYVENLVNSINRYNADIAISRFVEVDVNGNYLRKSIRSNGNHEVMNSSEALKNMFLQKKYDNSAWAKIYKRNICEHFLYPEEILYEDIAVTYQMLMEANRIVFFDSVDYFYVQRPNSILSGDFNENKLVLIKHINEMMRTVEKYDSSLVPYAGSKCFSALISLWRSIPYDNINNKYMWNVIKKYIYYPLKTPDSKMKLKLAVISINLLPRKINYLLMSR